MESKGDSVRHDWRGETGEGIVRQEEKGREWTNNNMTVIEHYR